MAKKIEHKAKRGGSRLPTRDNLYSRVANHLPEAIETLVELMKSAKQETVRVSAAKTLLDKGLPDIKSVELTGEDHGPLVIKIIAESQKHHDTD